MSYRKSYSTRRTKEFQSDPVDVAARYCIAQEDQDGFLLHEIDSIIGKGVFTKQKFKKNSFLLQYMGDLVSAEEGKKREIAYAHSMKGCFVFYFEHQFEKENFKRELRYTFNATI
ncbi:N-lysine methyltransferase KMT5A-A-like [Hydra vulgaris]|uniref:N-lysine methyltransferase KMT5A-A-like n=1 Tax=Hydra vulgaris TaxID=6087 RepID=A0ABM4CV54_HYDVU